MLFGRVVRPPAVAAELSELPAIRLGPGDLLVSDGSFVGVVAETDRAALLAARRVARAAHWKLADSPGPLPDERDLRAFLLAAPSEPEPVVEQPDPARPPRPPAR